MVRKRPPLDIQNTSVTNYAKFVYQCKEKIVQSVPTSLHVFQVKLVGQLIEQSIRTALQASFCEIPPLFYVSFSEKKQTNRLSFTT